jgi:chitin synthase
MYYLLCYKLFGRKDHKDIEKTFNNFNNFSGFGEFLKNMSEDRKIKAQNTFILALDGDVDFKPEAVLLLVDRMRKNLKVGAACGRIHPIGSGPMVWYQKFEYAVGHWLQKAAEHKLGCVLCSPGCFSLFRGSALMDDNVMRRYADKATEASHYVQYDQGEDRWLCTLLLQEGYRVDYCAASDALTYAPETFNEFFNQRRRWMPSTIANILDLLKDAKHTVLVNGNISLLYIFYQGFLLASTILGPGTILLTVASSFRTVFNGLTLAESYTLAVAPAVFYLIICLKTKPKTQVFVGALMSSIYSMIMTMVLVATIAQITSSDELTASSVFFVILVVLFFITGILHPQEMLNLVYGILYLVTLPGGYVLLVIYSICNLHIVSWGTREVASRIKSKPQDTQQQQDDNNQQQQPNAKRNPIMAFIFGDDSRKGMLNSTAVFFQQLIKPSANRQERLLVDICAKLDNMRSVNGAIADPPKSSRSLSAPNTLVDNVTPKPAYYNDPVAGNNRQALDLAAILDPNNNHQQTPPKDVDHTLPPSYKSQQDNTTMIDIPRNDLYNPYWIDMKFLGKGDIYYMNTKEITFWQGLIDKYLYPLSKDEEQEQRITRDLKELRNNSCFAFFMLNALWVVMQFQFEYVAMTFPSLQIPIGRLYNRPDQKVQILGLIFLTFFTAVLVLQFVSMLFHRWGTIIEILASTRLITRHNKYKYDKLKIQEAVDMIRELELEKGGGGGHRLFDGSTTTGTGTTGTSLTDDETQQLVDEPEPDYDVDDEDILPEPEPDYFDHPAVQDAENWNRRNRGGLFSPIWSPQNGLFSARSVNVHGNVYQYPRRAVSNQHTSTNTPHLPMGQQLSHNHSYHLPVAAKHSQNQQQQQQHQQMVFSPRQNALRPLTSLDERVIRHFRQREHRDPHFKKRVKDIQNKVFSPNPINVDYNYNV